MHSFINDGGGVSESLSSMGRVSWLLNPISGLCHLKVKYCWLLGARDRLKKASLRSRTVYHYQSGSNKLSRVSWLGTVSCTSITLLLTSRKSRTNL